jgi:predicted RNA-binding protein
VRQPQPRRQDLSTVIEPEPLALDHGGRVLAEDVLAERVLVEGVLVEGVLAERVFAQGVLAQGVLAQRILAQRVLVEPILAKHALAGSVLVEDVLVQRGWRGRRQILAGLDPFALAQQLFLGALGEMLRLIDRDGVPDGAHADRDGSQDQYGDDHPGPEIGGVVPAQLHGSSLPGPNL